MAQKEHNFKHGLYFTAVLIVLSLIISMAVMPTGIENNLASSLYNENDKFSWFLRQYGAVPIMVFSLLSLILLAVPKLRSMCPMASRMASVWLVTFVIGGGLVCSVITKELVERPRPRETVLTEGLLPADIAMKGQSAEIVGKSFVSGHTAAAAMMIVPAFVLWQSRRRKAAVTVFVLGSAYAALIAYSRMVLGAHFLTDNLWAYTFIAGTAALTTPLFKNRVLTNSVIVPALIVGGLCMVLFNDFTVRAKIEATTKRYDMALTCSQVNILAQEEPTTFSATITGAGAPISNIQLKQDAMDITLKTMGLYRNLKCPLLTVGLKRGERIRIPVEKVGTDIHVTVGRYTQVVKTNGWFSFYVPHNVREIDHTPIGYYPPKASNDQK